MSKRRNRERQPNIPMDALQRAREQAGLPAAPTPSEPTTVEVEAPAELTSAAPVGVSAPTVMPSAAGAVKRQRKVGSAQLNSAKKRGETDQDKIKYLLENPTKIVSEAELRQEYFHVLIDLRNMGLLAAILIAILVVLAQFI